MAGSGRVRAAGGRDVDRMVALSAAKRRSYAAFEPVFWRPAADAGERQRAWFIRRVASADVVALVREAQGDGGVDGFLIGSLGAAPPVYEPGGLACVVDDFCVADEGDWATVGAELLACLRAAARARGAAILVVVSGARDVAKGAALRAAGLHAASEWLVGPV